MSIDLHIERVVIDEAVLGGERADRVRAALEGGLARLLAQPGAIDALRGQGAVAVLPPADLPAVMHPHRSLGSRVAAALRQTLSLHVDNRDRSAARHG